MAPRSADAAISLLQCASRREASGGSALSIKLQTCENRRFAQSPDKRPAMTPKGTNKSFAMLPSHFDSAVWTVLI
jgi:hypothetical protein